MSEARQQAAELAGRLASEAAEREQQRLAQERAAREAAERAAAAQAAAVIRPAELSEAAQQAALVAQRVAAGGSIMEGGGTKPEYRLNQLTADIGLIKLYKKDVEKYNDAFSAAVNTIDSNVSQYNQINKADTWDQYDWSDYGGKAGYIKTVKDQIAYGEQLKNEHASVNVDAKNFGADKRLDLLNAQTNLLKSRISGVKKRQPEYGEHPLKTQIDYLGELVAAGVVDVKSTTVKRGDPGAVSSSADKFVLTKDYDKLSDNEKNLLIAAGFTITTTTVKDIKPIKTSILVEAGILKAIAPGTAPIMDVIDEKIEATLRDLEAKAGWEHSRDYRITPMDNPVTSEEAIARLQHLGLSFGVGAVRTAPYVAAAALTGPIGSALIAAGMIGSLALNAPAAAAYARAHPEEFAAGILGSIAAGVAISSVITAYRNGRLSLPKTQRQKIEATLKAKLDAAYKGLDESAYKGTLKQPGASSIEDYGRALTRVYDEMGWEKPSEWFPGVKSDLVGKSAVELAKELGQGGYVGGELSAVDKMLAAQKILAWERANPDQVTLLRKLSTELGDARMVVVSLDYSNLATIQTPLADLTRFAANRPNMPIVISIISALQRQGLSNEQISNILPILLGTNVNTAASATTRLDDEALKVVIPSLSMNMLTIVVPRLTIKQLNEIRSDLSITQIIAIIPVITPAQFDEIRSDLSITQIIAVIPALSPAQVAAVVQDLRIDQIQEVLSVVDVVTAQLVIDKLPEPMAKKLRVWLKGKKGLKLKAAPRATPPGKPMRFRVVLDGRVSTVAAGSFVEALSRVSRGRGSRATVTRIS